MPSYNATGLVLHRTDLGENDRVLTIYTREKGKLSAVAKGSRRAASRLSGATELFIAARLQLAVGRTLDIVTQCEIANSFVQLRTDLQRLARATYFCELLDRFTGERDESSCRDLFDLTIHALLMLQTADVYPDAVVHAYELQLLAVLGYAPVLDRCVVCGGAVTTKGAGLSPALGGLVCATDRSRSSDAVALGPESIHVLRTLQLADPDAILALQPSRQTAAEVARALRWFVRYRCERNLKSADFLDQLRASQ